MLNTLSHAFVATTSVREISGRLLAFNRMKPRARAKLAADLVDRRVAIVGLTVRQAARLCRVGRASVTDALRPASKTLMKAWAAASAEERRQFVERAGAETIWQTLSTTL